MPCPSAYRPQGQPVNFPKAGLVAGPVTPKAAHEQAQDREDGNAEGERELVVFGHLPASQASAAAHETAAVRQARSSLAIPEFWKLVQTCSQVEPFAVGFADGHPNLTMFAHTVAQVVEGVGGQAESENAKRMGMRMRRMLHLLGFR